MLQLTLRALALSLCVTTLSPLGSAEGKPRRSSKSQQKQSFKRLVSQAVQAYKAERFEEAIIAFKRALKLNPQHRLHWNLAVLYERTDRLELALYHVDAFLKDPKLKPENRVKAMARRAQITEQLAAAQAQAEPSPSPSPRPLPTQPLAAPVYQGGEAAGSGGEVVEVETVQVSIARGMPEWGYWAIGGGLMMIAGAGLHVYADQVWSERPNTLSGAEEAQSSATTYSWIGDVFLVGGVTSAVISYLKWSSRGAPSSYSELRQRGQGRALGGHGGALHFTGQALIWSGRF